MILFTSSTKCSAPGAPQFGITRGFFGLLKWEMLTILESYINLIHGPSRYRWGVKPPKICHLEAARLGFPAMTSSNSGFTEFFGIQIYPWEATASAGDTFLFFLRGLCGVFWWRHTLSSLSDAQASDRSKKKKQDLATSVSTSREVAAGQQMDYFNFNGDTDQKPCGPPLFCLFHTVWPRAVDGRKIPFQLCCRCSPMLRHITHHILPIYLVDLTPLKLQATVATQLVRHDSYMACFSSNLRKNNGKIWQHAVRNCPPLSTSLNSWESTVNHHQQNPTVLITLQALAALARRRPSSRACCDPAVRSSWTKESKWKH